MRDSNGLSVGIFAMGMPLRWRDIGVGDMLVHSVAVIAGLMSVLVPWHLPGVSVADVRDLTEWTNWRQR